MARRSLQRSLLAWQAAAAIAATCAVLLLVQRMPPASDAQRIAPNDYGQPVPDVPAIDGVQVHSPCRIARFGLAPYNPHFNRGEAWQISTRAALMLMGLPLEVANRAIQRLRTGQIDDTVDVGSTGGQAVHSRQGYAPVFSTTFNQGTGPFVCHATRIVYPNPNRTEPARLIVIPSPQGAYHVAEFTVCGNVSRLIAHDGTEAVLQGKVREAPEPGTLGLAAAGLVACWIVTRRARKDAA